jgi:DeoR family fructose operon transcriptional repressor
MLTEKRFSEILNLVNTHGTISVQELTKILNASESTIRRDLAALGDMGRLRKIYGGASSLETVTITKDDAVADREIRHLDEKRRIAQAAAALVQPDDFVYIDAGTSTALFAEQISPGAVFVTNALFHARILSRKGCRVYLPGGELKSVTEAIIGEKVLEDLLNYHFTKGFFGTNGITIAAGFSTPDIREAAVKRRALRQCQKAFVLADPSKFGLVSSVSFASFSEADIITTRLDDIAFSGKANIMEVD